MQVHQKFSIEPSEKGGYQVIRWNELKDKWEPIACEIYPTEEQAKGKAELLNNEYYEEIRKLPGTGQ